LIVERKVAKAYALVRPPGHHAHSDMVAGFCFFNNVAIAAAKFVELGKRVLIVDWDIH
jgi:acetoin utilization deacetylase AcuC-like enzyme